MMTGLPFKEDDWAVMEMQQNNPTAALRNALTNEFVNGCTRGFQGYANDFADAFVQDFINGLITGFLEEFTEPFRQLVIDELIHNTGNLNLMELTLDDFVANRNS